MVAKRVLFLCTGNSCRSQMAEGWLRHIAGDRIEVCSAGTKPAGLNPLAVAVMREAGVDISSHHSKHVNAFSKQDFLFVITVCDSARETCPVFPGALYESHWSFDDPATATGSEEERLVVFRRVRDEIACQVRQFAERELSQLQPFMADKIKVVGDMVGPVIPLEEWERESSSSESPAEADEDVD
jgi:arsenate reductase (thioredoxin)